MKAILKLLTLSAVIISAYACKKAAPQLEEPELPTKITAINITYPSSKSLEIISGESATIKYELVPENATEDIEWESSNESVATVKKGKVNALTPGTATITVSSEDVSAKVKVTVLPIPVESIKVPAKIDSYIGIPQKFPVEISPKDALYSVRWNCSTGVELTLDEGDFFLNATQGDTTCTITFSADGIDDQVTVVNTYSKRMDIGMFGAGLLFIPFDEDASIEYDDILNSVSGKKLIFLSLYPVTPPEPSRVTVSSSDESVVKASVATSSTDGFGTNCLAIELEKGTSTGTSDITISYDDDVTGQVYTKYLNVSRNPATLPDGTYIAMVNGSSTHVSGVYSVRSTYDSRHSLSLCLTDKSGEKVSFPQGVWSCTDSSIELSRTTGDEVTVKIPYTKTAKTATISVKDELKSITCKVSILPARGFEGKLKCVVSDDPTYYTEKDTVLVDFKKEAKVGIFNDGILSVEEYGITWEVSETLRNSFFILGTTTGYRALLKTRDKVGGGTLTVISEQGERSTFTFKSGRSHISNAQIMAGNEAMTQESAIFSKSGSGKYVISQTTYFDVANNYGTSKQETLGGITWTMSNPNVENYYDSADKAQINKGRGCIHYFTATTVSEMNCTVSATDDYGKTLSINAEIRPWVSFTSQIGLYYRIKNGTESWSSWVKECNLGGDFNLSVRKEDSEVEYKIATSASGAPINIPMSLTSWKSTSNTDYMVKIMEVPSAAGCNVKIHVQKRSYTFPSGYLKITSPSGYPSFTLSFIDDNGIKYTSKATFIDNNK